MKNELRQFRYITCLLVAVISLFASHVECVWSDEVSPISSWKDLSLWRTTEEEFISTNPNGIIYLVPADYVALTKGARKSHQIFYEIEETSGAKKNKIARIEEALRKDGGPSDKQIRAVTDAMQRSNPYNPAIEPPFFKNGPIDLTWGKLYSAGLTVLIDEAGRVFSWEMTYKFMDYSDSDGMIYTMNNLPDKMEIMEMLKIAFGEPTKILKSNDSTDKYIFSPISKHIVVDVSYMRDKGVSDVEVREIVPISIEKAKEGLEAARKDSNKELEESLLLYAKENGINIE